MRAIPTDYFLDQNYPNPVPILRPRSGSPSLAGGRGERTILRVYDLLGKKLREILNSIVPPGIHECGGTPRASLRECTIAFSVPDPSWGTKALSGARSSHGHVTPWNDRYGALWISMERGNSRPSINMELCRAGAQRAFQVDDGDPCGKQSTPDLMAEGVIPDPFFRMNENACSVGRKSFGIYRREFHVLPDLLAEEEDRAGLRRSDTIASICINGRPAGKPPILFVRHRFDVKQASSRWQKYHRGNFYIRRGVRSKSLGRKPISLSA